MAETRRHLRYKNWMVTSFDLENFHVPDEHPLFAYMIYQPEECPDTKRWHIQGYLELKKQTVFNTVVGMFKCVVHLEARRGTQQEAIAYCSKKETRIAEPIEFGTLIREECGKRTDLDVARKQILAHTSWHAVLQDPTLVSVVSRYLNWAKEVFNSRPLAVIPPPITLRKWQKKALDIFNGPPTKRQIIWIWSYQSGTGKTTFFDYCSAHFSILPGADFVNTLYLYNSERIIWFDRTRSESNDDKGTSRFYSTLESLSNHTIHSSTKYQGLRKHVCAHVVVTANGRPDGALLPDRFLEIEAKHAKEEEPEEEVDEMSVDVAEDSQ